MEAFYCLIRCCCFLYARRCVHLKAMLQEMWNVQDLEARPFGIHRSRGSRQVYAVTLYRTFQCKARWWLDSLNWQCFCVSHFDSWLLKVTSKTLLFTQTQLTSFQEQLWVGRYHVRISIPEAPLRGPFCLASIRGCFCSLKLILLLCRSSKHVLFFMTD